MFRLEEEGECLEQDLPECLANQHAFLRQLVVDFTALRSLCEREIVGTAKDEGSS